MEREFKSLTEDDIAPGRKCVSEILSTSGKKSSDYGRRAMAYTIKYAMTKEFNLKKLLSTWLQNE